MDDDIQLPPLPPFVIAPIADEQTVRDYARAAVLADRERRALWEAQPAKPTVHARTYSLTRTGIAIAPYDNDGRVTTVTIRWTDDGRAWIDSERNRALARVLRYWTIDDKFAALDNAADALDGGAG